MPPTRLAVIGCGIAARDLHWPALKKLRTKLRIVMVCNHTPRKAREFARLVGGVPYVLDYREVLENPEVDAVDIALPIHLNYEATDAALRSGKHVLVEKPLAATLVQARRLVRLAGSLPNVAMVAENFRYRAVYRRAARILRRGEIGRPYAVFWTILQNMATTNKYARTRWRRHPQYAGGFITDGGVHNIAVLRMLFGEIRPLWSAVRQVNPGLGPADTFVLHFTTDEEATGVLTICHSAIGQQQNRLTILGKAGSMVVDGESIVVKGRKSRTERLHDDGGYAAQFEDFHSAIVRGTPVVSSFEEGYADLKGILRGLRRAE